MQRHAPTADVSLCSRADELSQSEVPLQLMSGWFDATAAAAINLFIHCGQAPGQPWHLSSVRLCVVDLDSYQLSWPDVR